MFGLESDEEVPKWSTRVLGPKHHKSRMIREWALIIVIALVASLLIRSYLFQTFYIPSGSMEPTLLIGDRIVVDKVSADLGSINRGDIVVFKAPPTENCGGEPVTDLVKRVIGLPGDHLSSVGNTIYVNGRPLKEDWPHTEPLGPTITATTVKTGMYFVMGDNHNNSCDSRYWGTVPRTNIIGKAFVRIWPLNRLGWF
jgi:signal peptidase I